MLKGVNASEGIGIGKVMLIEEVSLDYEKKQITDTQAEIDRYRKVFDAYCEKTEKQDYYTWYFDYNCYRHYSYSK